MNSSRFRLDGRTIFQRPVETKRPDGSTGITLGFPVCEVLEHVNEPQAVLNLMNAGDAAASGRSILPDDHPLVVVLREALWYVDGAAERLKRTNETTPRELANRIRAALASVREGGG